VSPLACSVKEAGPELVADLLQALVTEQARQGAQIAAILRLLERGRGARDEADAALLVAVVESVGDRQFTSRQLEAHAEFETMHEPESNILCFRWIGDGSFGDEALDAFNRELRESYNRSGEGWITATNLAGRRVLRVTLMNPRTTESDVAEIIAGLARQAEVMQAAN